MRLESSMIQRMSKAEQNCQTVRAKTLQEKFWSETPTESSRWHRRGDTRRQTVPYARSHDWKWVITNAGVAHQCFNVDTTSVTRNTLIRSSISSQVRHVHHFLVIHFHIIFTQSLFQSQTIPAPATWSIIFSPTLSAAPPCLRQYLGVVS